MKRNRPWAAAFAIVVAGVVVSHLVGLATAPPGLHSDEASIGYNAWTIAHYGTDQYGTPWPLLFRDFGDYKGPISTYLLAPLTLVLPLTPAITRLPSAFAGIAVAVVAGWLAWRMTRSRPVALLILLEAAFEPWFFHTARINLEADLFTVLCLVTALAALAGGGAQRARNCLVAGVALGLAPLAAQPGRFFAAFFLVLLVVTHRRSLRRVCVALLGVPVAITTLVLVVGTSGHATARLSDVSVFSHNSALGGTAAWIRNYLQYFTPDFLFLHGDPNPRHSTGFGGLLFVTTLPVLVAGLVIGVRRWREPLCRLALAGLVIAPVGPALTTGISARRDILFLPFLLVVLTYGWQGALTFLRGHRARIAVTAVLIATAAGLYFVDYAIAYPMRSALAFYAGEEAGFVAAHAAAGTHTILVSSHIQQALEEALFAIRPAPGPDAFARIHLADLVSQAQLQRARPGDVAILGGGELAPAGYALIDQQTVTGPTSIGGPSTTLVLVNVYQHR
ncbi:MAG: ArnT family glycosyltransferase [Candidatus Dormibacteria bacterium]